MQHKLLTMTYQRVTQGFCCRFDCSDALQYGSAMKGVHLIFVACFIETYRTMQRRPVVQL